MPEKYCTKQRSAIETFFALHPEQCYSAKEVIASTKTKAGEATVYRILNKLADEGVLARLAALAGRGSIYRYTRAPACIGHIHLKCVKCDEVVHLECPVLEHLAIHIENEHAFSVDSGRTIIYGLCNGCK